MLARTNSDRIDRNQSYQTVETMLVPPVFLILVTDTAGSDLDTVHY